MVEFKDAQNVVPHNFANNVLKIGTIIVNGLDSFAYSDQVDSVTWASVGDGLGQFAIDPDESGVFTFTVAEAMDSTDELWALRETMAVFSLSFTDPAAPNFNCSGAQCLFVKKPDILRDKEIPRVEWQVICGYPKVTGGSFTLST
jgi:hypothetical protein